MRRQYGRSRSPWLIDWNILTIFLLRTIHNILTVFGQRLEYLEIRLSHRHQIVFRSNFVVNIFLQNANVRLVNAILCIFVCVCHLPISDRDANHRQRKIYIHDRLRANRQLSQNHRDFWPSELVSIRRMCRWWTPLCRHRPIWTFRKKKKQNKMHKRHCDGVMNMKSHELTTVGNESFVFGSMTAPSLILTLDSDRCSGRVVVSMAAGTTATFAGFAVAGFV